MLVIAQLCLALTIVAASENGDPPNASIGLPASLRTSMTSRGIQVDATAVPVCCEPERLAFFERAVAVVEALNIHCDITRQAYSVRHVVGRVEPSKPVAQPVPLLLLPYASLLRERPSCRQDAVSASADGNLEQRRSAYGKYFSRQSVGPSELSPLCPMPAFPVDAVVPDGRLADFGRLVAPVTVLNTYTVASRSAWESPLIGRARVSSVSGSVWELSISDARAVDSRPAERILYTGFVFPILDAHGMARSPDTDPRFAERRGTTENLVRCSGVTTLLESQLPLVVPCPPAADAIRGVFEHGVPASQERICIPESLLLAHDGFLFVTRDSTWRPLQEDVNLSADAPDLARLELVAVSTAVSDRGLVRLLVMLSGKRPSQADIDAGLRAIKSLRAR
ncbi:MAG: hypothetical protein IT438_07515 [Phycisphaerales bacterium]|nr:hypothetical protein [Phycisphaerales bacterium]